MKIRSLCMGLVAALAVSFLQGRTSAAENGGKDIVTTAVEAGSFKTLAAALQAAGLVETLQGDGPFTVFAPTDEAFDKLPEGTVETLLKPANKQQLIAILTYHVVPGKIMAADVFKLKKAGTVNGQQVDIQVGGGKVKLNQANVVKTDIGCSNGVIHVIDEVILPAADSIPATADKAGQFKTLLAAAKAAGLVEALSGDQELTVFAPTDEAFQKLPPGTVETLLKPENKAQLASILKFHVVPGRVYSTALLKQKQAKTLQGSTLTASVKNGAASVNGAKLLSTDMDAANGVIHVIDTVLIPPKAPAKGAQSAEKTWHYVSYTCPTTGRRMIKRVSRVQH